MARCVFLTEKVSLPVIHVIVKAFQKILILVNTFTGFILYIGDIIMSLSKGLA